MIILLLALLIASCTSEPPTVQTTGTVSNVRLTFQHSIVKPTSGNSSAALGAYVGSVTIGGPIGAAVGAGLAADNNGTQTLQINELIACSFTVTVEKRSATFRISGFGDSGYAHHMRICSTLRDGDSIKVSPDGDKLEWHGELSE